MGKSCNIKDCLCDEEAKAALNAAFVLCVGHGFHDKCSTKSRNKATLVTRDRLNQYIVSILNNSNKPTTAVCLLVKKEKYAVCQSIVTKINKELGTSTADPNNTNVASILDPPGGGDGVGVMLPRAARSQNKKHPCWQQQK